MRLRFTIVNDSMAFRFEDKSFPTSAGLSHEFAELILYYCALRENRLSARNPLPPSMSLK